jgi:hypothetical protein
MRKCLRDKHQPGLPSILSYSFKDSQSQWLAR